MKRFTYSLFAACLSLGMGLSAVAGTANAAQPSLMATPSAQTSAPNVQNIQYYDHRDDHRYWREQRRYWRHDRPYHRYDRRYWGHLPPIATVQLRSIGVATRMCVGATIVIALIEPTITRSSPITGRGASATRHISESKSPG